MSNNHVVGHAFAESGDEEASRIIAPATLNSIHAKLAGQMTLNPEESLKVAALMEVMVSLFSTDLPTLIGDVQEELSKSSQEINLGRFLREKAIVRIYMLTRHTADNGEPLYTQMKHPDTGEIFTSQEDFLGWWCAAASVSRALIFQRLATYRRLEDIGFTLEESYEVMKQRPSVITESLRELCVWDKTSLVKFPEAVASNLARNIPDESAKHKAEALIKKESGEGLSFKEQKELNELLRPPLKELVEDVAFFYESSRDAIKEVKYGITGKPEIKFSWDVFSNSLIVTLQYVSVEEDGTKKFLPEERVVFVPDTYENMVPNAIIEVMEKKLSITNKGELL